MGRLAGVGGVTMENTEIIDLYEAICLMDLTVTDVPPEVARRVLADEDAPMPLVAVAYRGPVPVHQRWETTCLIAAAPHLGYLVGAIRAAMDRMDDDARAMFLTAHEEGYAIGERRHPAKANPDQRDV